MPLLVYVPLTLGLTWPLVTRWTTHLPGGPHKDGLEDAYQNVWNLWWMKEALLRPTTPFVTDRFFYPERPNLYYHTLSPVNSFLAVPITALWGPIAGFNAVAFVSFVVGALGAWALARDRTGSDAGALLAGIVYAFSPFHLAALVEDGQMQIVALHWLPFYILFLLRAVERGGRRTILLAGLFLVLAAWTDWYYTLFLLLFSAGYVVWRLVARAPDWAARRTLIGRVSAIGILFALGAAPLFIPMLLEAAHHTYMYQYPPSDPQRLSADLLAYVLPARLHPWWGAAPWSWGVSVVVNRRLYLGGVALALAAIGMWRASGARRWGLIALVFGLLSLGPALRVGGESTGLPLPYRLLADLPLIRLTRQPDRFDVLVTLALAVMVAYGVRTLLAVLRRPVATPLTLVLMLLVVIDYLPAPLATRQPPVPPFLATLPYPPEGALLEYPFHADVPYRDAERMLFQTIHGRPISGGYHSRLYPQPQFGLPVLRDLAAGQLASDIVAETGGWRAALNALDYRYIIGYKQQPLGPRNLEPDEAAAFRGLVNRGLAVAGPDYEDAWLIAYRVPDAAPRPVVQLRDGWSTVEATASGGRYRWLPRDAQLGLFVQTAGSYQLSFTAQPAGGPRRIALQTPRQSALLPLSTGQRRYGMILDLPAGRTILSISALEPPTTGDALEHNGDRRPISVRFSNITLERVEARLLTRSRRSSSEVPARPSGRLADRAAIPCARTPNRERATTSPL